MTEFTRSFPRLETSRLIVRSPQLQDASALLDFHVRNDAHLASTSPPKPDGFETLHYWEQYIHHSRRDFQEGTSCRLVVCARSHEHRIIAKVNFSQIVRGPFQACYLGYAVDADEEGKGYMTEACEAAIHYAFTALHLHRVMANYLPTNERSGRLLRRLGFIVEGYARDYLMIDGAWRDHILTACTHPDWT